MPIKIAPSLASAPMINLADTVRRLEAAGADYLHFDVEDGTFVPAMTLGMRLICELRPLTSLPFDVHLMMINPEWIIPRLIECGADRITVHYEACPYPRRTLRLIALHGRAAGLAFNPATPLPDLAYLRPYLSIVNILTTEPEIPDAPYLPAMLEKIQRGKAQPGLEGVEWVADGGINDHNIGALTQAGIDTIVVGRFIFRNSYIAENLAALRAALGA